MRRKAQKGAGREAGISIAWRVIGELRLRKRRPVWEIVFTDASALAEIKTGREWGGAPGVDKSEGRP